jgi:hypothetical protein
VADRDTQIFLCAGSGETASFGQLASDRALELDTLSRPTLRRFFCEHATASKRAHFAAETFVALSLHGKIA